MPVPCFAHPPPVVPGMPKGASRRRGSVAIVPASRQEKKPPCLTVRRASLGRIFIEPEDEALAIFSKYQQGFARRLKKTEALDMLMKEFGLDDNEADLMFVAFDKDNNEVMSLWEFRQFYQTVGKRAHVTIELFKSLEKEGSGKIDIEKAFDKLADVESGKGKLTEDEIEMFLRTTAGEEKEIDFSKFLNMMCRINLHKGPE